MRRRGLTIVAVAITATACTAAMAATPGAGTYKGLTSQKDPKTKKAAKVEVKVGKGGKRVKRIRAGFRTACADGTGYLSGFGYIPGVDDRAVRKGGKFSFETTYKPPDLNPGETADVFVRGPAASPARSG